MSTETKVAHTPGPWTVHSWTVNRMTERVIRGGERNVATMTRANYAEADARLIAAAPDLLAALKDLIALVNDMPYPVKSDGELIAAERAIVKAEGQ